MAKIGARRCRWPRRINNMGYLSILEEDADERLIAGLAADSLEPNPWQRQPPLTAEQFCRRHGISTAREHAPSRARPPPPESPKVDPAAPVEREETYALAVVCLVDALIEMRPYVHPSHYEQGG